MLIFSKGKIFLVKHYHSMKSFALIGISLSIIGFFISMLNLLTDSFLHCLTITDVLYFTMFSFLGVVFSGTVVLLDSVEEFKPVGEEKKISVISLKKINDGYLVSFRSDSNILCHEKYTKEIIVNDDIDKVVGVAMVIQNALGEQRLEMLKVEAPSWSLWSL